MRSTRANIHANTSRKRQLTKSGIGLMFGKVMRRTNVTLEQPLAFPTVGAKHTGTTLKMSLFDLGLQDLIYVS